MIVAESYLHFHDDSRTSDFRTLAQRAFPLVEVATRDFLTQLEYPRTAELLVEEGSTKLRGIIRVSAMALIAYGGIRQAIDYARHDGKLAAGWINERFRSLVDIPPESKIAERRRTPAPTRLRHLFDSVENGSITASEAADRAEKILEEYREPPETIARVVPALREEFLLLVPRDPTPRPPAPPNEPRYPTPQHFDVGRRLRVYRNPATGQLRYVEE